MDLLFCTAENYYGLFIGGILMMMAVTFLLVLLLSINAKYFFCPTLRILGKMMHMSEGLVGVTILSIGNSIPSLLDMIVYGTKKSKLLRGEISAAGLFVTTFVAGCICLTRPFKLVKAYFIRDCWCFLIGYLWVSASGYANRLTGWDALSYIGIYLVYLSIAIFQHFQLRSESGSNEIAESTVPPEANLFFNRATDEQPSNAVVEVFRTLNPITLKKWWEASVWDKIVAILMYIPVLILKLFIPVIDYTAPRNGWCRPLNVLQCILLPMYIIVLENIFMNRIVLFIQIWMVVLPLALVLAVLVWFTSVPDAPPAYHNAFAVASYIGVIITSGNIIYELAGLISSLGFVLQITDGTLAVTALAWRHSIGDLVSNMVLAHQGLEKMAFAGCFGATILNALFAMGVIFFEETSFTGSVGFRPGAHSKTCTTFLVLSLVSSILMMIVTKYHARKSYGAFLIISYFTFLSFVILGELSLLHPFGTDHFMEPEEEVQNVQINIS